MSEEQQIPHDLNAERAVLGCCLSDRNAMYVVLETLEGDEFFHPPHGVMYRAIIALQERGVDVDMMTVTNELMTEGTLGDAGHADYIAGLTTNVVGSERNARHYANIVSEQARLRTLCKIATRMHDAAIGPGRDSSKVLDGVMTELIQISRRTLNGRASSNIRDGVIEAVERSIKLSEMEGGGLLRFGFPKLDKTVNLLAGDLFVLGGRTSHGKTALAVTLCLEICKRNGRILFISTEMDRVQMTHRFIAAIAGIRIDLMRRGVVADLAQMPAVETLMAFGNAIRIVFAPGCSKTGAMRLIKQDLIEHGAQDIVVVDYLQRMRCAGRPQDRRIAIADIANSLKDIAGELGIRILLLSQIARPTGQDRAKNKPPTIYDLKEAGDIEEAGDTVGLLHRLDADKSMPEWGVDLLIEKNRNGPLADINLILNRKTATFREATGPPRAR